MLIISFIIINCCLKNTKDLDIIIFELNTDRISVKQSDCRTKPNDTNCNPHSDYDSNCYETKTQKLQ